MSVSVTASVAQLNAEVLFALALKTTRSRIANTLGLDRNALSRTSHIRRSNPKPIDGDIEPRRNSNRVAATAYAWFRSEPLPFGRATSDQLLREGRTDKVYIHPAWIRSGGYT